MLERLNEVAVKARKVALLETDRVGLWLKKAGAPRAFVDAVLLPSDRLKIRHAYRKAFGYEPDLENPRTFNEWLQYTKIHNRRSHHPIISDKVAVREYIAERIGSDMLPRLYWSGASLSECDRAALPDRFVIKVNQGSGSNIVVHDKKTADWPSICQSTDMLLRKDWSIPCAEWQYRWIKPQVLVEEYLETPGHQSLIEFQFFCIMGRCEFVEVDFDRFTEHRRLYFGRDFQPIDMQIRLPAYEQPFAKPAFYEQMLQAAETFAREEMFLRVDFYDVGRPVIGELTLHPGSGMVKFKPPEWDERLGRLFRKTTGE
jgi:hypothetical protein